MKAAGQGAGRCLVATVASLGIVCLGPAATFAAAFTPGDVVVYRIGDGTPLVNTGNAVFLDEFTPAGMLVQSLPLPTLANGANNPLVASGTATSEGQLGRSADAQFLLLTGYDTTLPASESLSKSAAAAVPRTIGRVKFDGSIDTSTALTDFADANNPRSAASTDGLNLWVGGAAGGVRYALLGSSTSTQLSTDSSDARYIGVFDGQLYMSTQKGGAIRIGTVGTGIPIMTGQDIVNLPGLATSGAPDAFFFADLDGMAGVDTLYVADEGAGIEKFSLSSGKWFSNGVVGTGGDAYRGIAGAVSGTTVTLYATRKGDSGGDLVQVVDASGYNNTLTGPPALMASAAANQAFRGVAMAPMGAGPSPVTDTPTPTATAMPPTSTATTGAEATPTSSATPSATTTAAQSPAATDSATVKPTGTASPVQTATTPVAGAFTPGNVVVYRIGDGAAALTDNGNAVFLDEYTPSGTLVQSVPLPVAASGSQYQLIASTDVSEGLTARSTDGQFIMLTGYGADLGGGTALATTAGTSVPRVVGRVKYDGTVDTSTALSDFSSSNNPRSATSTDGVDIWVGGASGSSGGVHYTTFGMSTSTQLFASIPKGVRQVNIFGGQLYFDSNTVGLLNVSAVGTGIPTTGGQTGVELPGLPDTTGNDGYFFADLGDGHGLATLYVANDSAGAILKYALLGGTWTASGTITAAAAHGVTGTVEGRDVILYATGTSGTDGTLFTFTDASGFGGTASGAATVIAAAAANQAFRGVALAPEASGLPPSTPTAPAGPTASATIAVSPTAIPSPTSTALTPVQATDTPAMTAVASVTATPPTPACIGDCNGDRLVTINEILVGVNIALGSAPLDACPQFNCQGNGAVSVACLIQGVNAALDGCPAG